MKKGVFKKKKKIKVYRDCGSVKRVFFLAAAICVLAGMSLTVYGEEIKSQAVRVVINEIYHKHAGNSGEKGGCYSVPIAHEHQGDEKNGGPCYQMEVKHIHQGNENENGGCYTKPEYHQHQGDEYQGGACYEAVTHVHSDTCYQEERCIMNHTLTGGVLETWTERCFSHQETLYGRSAGIASHSSCGAEDEERFYRYCLACGTIAPTTHSYQKLVCQIEEGTVTGYQLSCAKDDKTIDRYVTECGFNELEREGYALSCTKTVEGYMTGCGLEENSLCGRMILTNETEGQAEQVTISACLEDITGGRLKPDVPAFEWRDEKGNPIGNEEKITVSENGRYSVTLRLKNRDVDEAGLKGSIVVDNILEVQSVATPSPVATPTSEPAEQENPVPDTEGKETSETTEKNDESGEAARYSPVPQISIVSQYTDVTESKQVEPLPDNKIKKNRKKAEALSSPAPVKPSVKKESRQIRVKENAAQEKIPYRVVREKKNTGFFDIPSVKIITVTGGVFFLLGGLLLLLFYLRNSVRIFNDDGEGKMVALGRCRVKTEGECYSVVITEAMVEKAFTNRYCIKPGLFLLGKKEGQELTVYKDTKGVSVDLKREMIIVI